jgi:hypothetical protein
LLAARGIRNLDTAEEAIGDSGMKARLRAIAGEIHINALLTAAVLTCLTSLF